jgi:hypothetical protein
MVQGLDIIVRVRGTFIDIDARSAPKNRSSSTPPSPSDRSRRSSEAEIDRHCAYLEAWLEGAKSLAEHRADSPTPSDTTCEEIDVDPSCGTPTNEEFDVLTNASDCQTLQDLHMFMDAAACCACGATYIPNGRFCHQCGQAKPDPALNHTSMDNAAVWSGHFAGASSRDDTDIGYGQSDSCATLPSIGSCGRGTASTLDSLSHLDSDLSACKYSNFAACSAVPEILASHPQKWADSPIDVDCHQPLHTMAVPPPPPPPSDDHTHWACAHPDEEVSGPITTLMMCDIPCRQTIRKVIDAINNHGFSGTYDMVYMPPQKGFRRPKHSQNMGYAFVNFKLPEYALAFGQAFQNFTFPHCASSKLSYCKPAHCQGYERNVEMHSKQRSSGCLLTFRDNVEYVH